jgi:hypothetical protein
MQRKKKIGYIIEAVLVFIIIAALASIAVPEIAEMID